MKFPFPDQFLRWDFDTHNFQFPIALGLILILNGFTTGQFTPAEVE